MKPYYQDEAVTIYHGDCREALSTLEFDAIVTDPPYGIDHKPGPHWNRQRIVGDNTLFDPSHLAIGTTSNSFGAVLFGANHYANLLPPSAGWLVWDKRDRTSRNLPGSDAEMAWTNLTDQVRLFTRVWIPHTIRGEVTWHPTQKPLGLMKWVLGFVPAAQVVVDPYMGAGTTLRAAKDLNRRAIGIEIEERYCEIAAKRLSQEVLDLWGKSAA